MRTNVQSSLGLVLLAAMPAAGIEIPEFEFDRFDTQTPSVTFDVPRSLTCRDVTTDLFRAERPGQRLVEVETPVSLLLLHGEPGRLQDVVIEIDGTASGLQVHDYSPKTALATELADPIELKRTTATNQTLGASLGASIAADVALTPTLSGGTTKSQSSTEIRNKLPPKQAIVVSGTTGGRAGVYYKLRPSTQSTLEGERTFKVTFIAPEDWSGGRVEVRCVARGEKKWLFVEQRRVWNETAQPVELRLVSHTVAKPTVAAVE